MALVLAVVLGLSACKTELYTGLNEQDANEILAALQRNGISASRELDQNDRIAVFVEEGQFAAAVDILRAEGYPKHQYSDLGQVFQGNGFVVSQTEERARFIYAMSEELSRTISEIDGVLSARTHVVLPTSDPLSRDSTPSSASVVIRHGAQSDTERLLPQIKMMVANSIEGLSYSNVSVVFIPVQTGVPEPIAAPAADGPGGMGMWFGVGIHWILVALATLPALVGAGLLTWRRGAPGPAFVVEKVADGETGR